MITSTRNPRIKLIVELQKKARTRRTERKIVLEGTKLIEDAIHAQQQPLYIVYDPASTDSNLITRLNDLNISAYEASQEVIVHASETQNPQGILGVFAIPQPKLNRQNHGTLILDAIRDPGNMGTILRTAGAAGIQSVILAPNCADPYNPKVLRSGMGAHFRVPIMEAGWQDIRQYLINQEIYLATGSAERSYTDVNWDGDWGLIIGNEAQGANKDAFSVATKLIKIPMANETESLNAAIATGVILFEARRQQNQ